MALTISSDKTNSVIGRQSFFEGRFHINGTLRIDGKFEGKTLHADQLYIGRSGRVKTNIAAANVVVEGIIIGNIVASNRVMLLPSSRVLGDIKTPELIIQNGVILEGLCKISHKLTESAKTLIEQMYTSAKEQ